MDHLIRRQIWQKPSSPSKPSKYKNYILGPVFTSPWGARRAFIEYSNWAIKIQNWAFGQFTLARWEPLQIA